MSVHARRCGSSQSVDSCAPDPARNHPRRDALFIKEVWFRGQRSRGFLLHSGIPSVLTSTVGSLDKIAPSPFAIFTGGGDTSFSASGSSTIWGSCCQPGKYR